MLLSPMSALVRAQQADPNTPFQHIIFLMQENHSFDNYFGTYPTANGSYITPITSQLQGVNGIPNWICLPYGSSCLSPTLSNSAIAPNPGEGQLTYEQDINNGAMNGFPTNSGPQSMTYFDYHYIPAYWDYAEEYGIGDNYFASVLSSTLPNRLMALMGDSQFASTDLSDPGFFSDLDNQLSNSFSNTLFYQLSANGISWGYYDFFNTPPFPSNEPFGLGTSIQNVSSLVTDLKTGTNLPQVSYVSSLEGNGLDELSPDNVTTGELWVVSIINALEQSTYWGSTALFLTWDEGGGYYDHVAPPQVLSIDHGFSSPLLGYGQRVPLIVISPYSKEDYVSTTTLNHMSILKFIDYDFNLAPLNQNVANSNNLLDFFDFSQSPRAPVVLGKSGEYSYGTYPIPLQMPISQLAYSRTGSYTGSESTQQPQSIESLFGQFEGIFTGSDKLLNNLASGKYSLITVSQVYSLVYLIIFIMIVVVIIRIALWVRRRRNRAKNATSQMAQTQRRTIDLSSQDHR